MMLMLPLIVFLLFVGPYDVCCRHSVGRISDVGIEAWDQDVTDEEAAHGHFEAEPLDSR